MYIQGGAEFVAEKNTKKALKEAIKERPTAVWLFSTSAFGGWSGFASDLPPGATFNVIGPDPYKKRSWYATVKKDPSGTVFCS